MAKLLIEKVFDEMKALVTAHGKDCGKLKKDEIKKMVDDLDRDGDGSVDFDEFMAMMSGKMVSAILLTRACSSN